MTQKTDEKIAGLYEGGLATEPAPRRRGLRVPRPRVGVPDESLSLALLLSGGLLLVMAARWLLAREVATPWIMADELIYSELAKNFAGSGDFLLRDAPSHLNNVAYPALIAPAWFADSIADAYDYARAINVLLMSLAAVPVFLWGRRLMPLGYALIAPALVLLMPAQLYTGMLMTENAFFPAVVTSCFAIGLALERPTLLRQAFALGAIAFTCAVRPQGLVLLVIYASALALRLVFDLRAPDRPGWRYVARAARPYWPTAAVLAVAALGYVVLNAARGQGLEAGLGAYGGVVKVEYDFSNVRAWVEDHFAEIGLAVGLFPVSALIVLFALSLRGWRSTPAERAFVAVAASAFVLIVVEVGIYASRFAVRIEERNMFAVAPLLFLALALWLARGAPRPIVTTVLAAIIPAALLFSLPLAALLNIGILSDTFGLVPLLRLSTLIDGGVERVELIMRAGGLAAALAFVLVPRRVAAVVLPSLLAAFFVLCSYSIHGAIRDHTQATQALTETSEPSWIDARLGTDADAAILYGGLADLFSEAQVLWQTEFWNRSVGPVYNIGPPDPATLSPHPARFDALSGHITSPDGSSPANEYVVAPRTLSLVGTRVAQQGGLVLYRMRPPLRLATHVGGVHADSWMGNFAALTHYAQPARVGRLRVLVSRRAWSGASPPGKVTISIGRLGEVAGGPGITNTTATRTWTVRSGAAREFVLPTPAFPYRLEIRVDPTFSPSRYGHVDTRELGAQIQLQPSS